jgi:predicted permease
VPSIFAALFRAVRTLGRAPVFTAGVVTTLGLGLGANAAMLSVLDQLYFRPPRHVTTPDRVVQLGVERHRGARIDTAVAFSYPAYASLRERATAVAGVALASYPVMAPLGRGTRAREVRTLLVSGEYWSVFGVRPAAGALFGVQHDRPPTGEPVVVVSEALWRRAYGADPALVGRTIELGAARYTVIGVAPLGFSGVEPLAIDAWIPVSAGETLRFGGTTWMRDRSSTWVRLYARMAPTARPDDVGAILTPRWHADGLARLGGDADRVVATSVLASRRTGGSGRIAGALVAISVLVLLVTCVNAAGLLVARAARRQRVTATRVALGASTSRLLHDAALEGAVLGGAGALVGLACAHGTAYVVRARWYADAAWADAPFSGRLVGPVLAAGLLLATAAGLLAAVEGHTPGVRGRLATSGRGAVFTRSRLRAGLLGLQVALSFALVAGSGLLVRSLRALQSAPLGWTPTGLLVGSMNLRRAGYRPADAEALLQEAAARAHGVDGVERVARATVIPFSSSFGARLFLAAGDTVPGIERGVASLAAVSAGYFETMRIRVLQGRALTDADAPARAAVVSRSLARAIAPNGDAVGRCVRVRADTAPCVPVVGVVADVRTSSLTDASPSPQLNVPLDPAAGDAGDRYLLVRVRPDAPERVARDVAAALRTTRADLPYARLEPIATVFADVLRPWQLGATLSTLYGVLALVLVGVGLYGVVAYVTAARTVEIGVRRALGGSTAHVTSVVLRYAARVVTVGLVGGAALAGVGQRAFADRLVAHDGRSVGVWLVAALAVGLSAALASCVPAWRAARIPPTEALRGE